MKRIKFVVFVSMFLFLLSGCSNYKFKATSDTPVEDFEFTNQHNEKVSLADLKGKPWLAMFIFTNCKTICPPMTFNMTEIQAALEKEGIEDYHIVAFSVDPKTDTPDALTEYLTNYTITDATKWQLLTGYDQTYIEQFAKRSFNSLVKNDPTSDQVVHMSQFYLVNADGITVKSYDGMTDVPVENIVFDMKALSQ